MDQKAALAYKWSEPCFLQQVLWTSKPCEKFHLLICLALLDTEKTTLIENNFGFTEILKVRMFVVETHSIGDGLGAIQALRNTGMAPCVCLWWRVNALDWRWFECVCGGE